MDITNESIVTIKESKITTEIKSCAVTADIYETTFTGTKMKQVNLDNAVIENSSCQNATFSEVALSGSTIENLSATGMRITGVNLSDTIIREADLSNLNICQCNIEGMTINGIKVTDLLEAYNK